MTQHASNHDYKNTLECNQNVFDVIDVIRENSEVWEKMVWENNEFKMTWACFNQETLK